MRDEDKTNISIFGFEKNNIPIYSSIGQFINTILLVVILFLIK